MKTEIENLLAKYEHKHQTAIYERDKHIDLNCDGLKASAYNHYSQQVFHYGEMVRDLRGVLKGEAK